MKRIITILALSFSIAIKAQNGAYIGYNIKSVKGANGTIKISYSEFGTLSEFSMQVPQMPVGVTNKSLTKSSNPQIIYLIDDKNKTYSEMKKTESTGKDSKTYTVKKIGDEKVNGYKCIHALVTEGNETHEVWNTKDIADFAKYSEIIKSNEKMGSSKREQALKDAGCDGLPVKILHKGNEGDMTMELVKVEKKSFTKADFEIPAGYSRNEGGGTSPAGPGVKSQQDIMNMTPEERAKYIEEMKKKYGKPD